MDYEVKNTTVLTDIDGGAWFSLDWWNAEYKKPTTKNDSGVNYTINDLDDFIEFGKKAFNVELTPIRPKGHWIDHSDEGYVECPRCGSATNCDGNIKDLHFCFSCGADMRGEEE